MFNKYSINESDIYKRTDRQILNERYGAMKRHDEEMAEGNNNM